MRWQWNWDELRSASGQKKNTGIIKLAFPFDEPALMDNCSFMCKIGKNIGENQETKYYGVAYATEEDSEALIEWGQRFPHAKLIRNLDPISLDTTDRSTVEYVKKKEAVQH